jgi:hypothetical protein
VGATTASTGAFTTLSATGASTIQNTLTITRSSSAARTLTLSLENGTADYITDATGAYPHRFFVGATKYAQIDTTGLAVTGALSSTTGATFATSSGNVGVGVASAAYKLDVDIGAVSGSKLFRFSGASGQSLFGYADSGGTGITKTDPYNTMLYFNTSNGIELYTASTQRVVVNSSGNVGIGTSAPVTGLHVKGAYPIGFATIERTGVNGGGPGSVVTFKNDGKTAGDGVILNIAGLDSADNEQAYAQIRSKIISPTSTSEAGEMQFWTTTAGSITQKMVVDSSGNVGVGTSSPAKKLHVSGDILVDNSTSSTIFLSNDYYKYITVAPSTGDYLAICQNPFASGIQFGKSTNAAPSTFVPLMTIAVGGNVGIGSGNATNGKLGINFAASGSLYGISLCDSLNTSGALFVTFQKSDGTTIGSIARVTTTDAVVYSTTSDGRLKENLRDFTDSGRLIDSLKPRVFDWKNSDENGKNVVGFIAQEEHAADPMFAHIGAVSVGDEDPETITKQWQRSDSALIPILVAELKALRQRVAALESN